VDAISYTKVAGTPFMESELVDVFAGYLGTTLAEAA
jgi:2-oxoglutarate/2-oxoacid ferredoxin oxidoreductase subunit alpha